MRVPCADTPDLMFTPGLVAVEAAKRLCAHCPVADRCAELGQGEQWGVWAGRTADERAELDRADDELFAVTATPVEVEQHGTRTARNAGCTCLRCIRAHTLYVREWRAARTDVTEPEASTAEQLDLFGRTA